MGEPTSTRYVTARDQIDRANAADPNTLSVRGEEGPKELLHGRLAVWWVLELDPEADELQLLAARGHHFRRWTHPRSDHPPGRAGYLRWRAAARRAHADDVASVLRSSGYSEEEAGRVASIIRKEGLSRDGATDPAVQVHEDALCLVFAETQLAGVTEQLGDDTTVQVLARTLSKMSDRAVEALLALPLDAGPRELLERAVGTAGAGSPAPLDGDRPVA